MCKTQMSDIIGRIARILHRNITCWLRRRLLCRLWRQAARPRLPPIADSHFLDYI